MSQNLEKDFLEHFKNSSDGNKSSDPISDLYEFDDEQDEYAELGELILRLQDNNIDQKSFSRLQQWLMNDTGALEYYVQYAFIYAGLSILLNKKHDISFLNHLVNAQT